LILQVIGQEKRALGGFSNAAAMKHTGVLHYCDLVQSCPPHLRRKGEMRGRGRRRERVWGRERRGSDRRRGRGRGEKL
jgi:hypothetical protein